MRKFFTPSLITPSPQFTVVWIVLSRFASDNACLTKNIFILRNSILAINKSQHYFSSAAIFSISVKLPSAILVRIGTRFLRVLRMVS